MFCPNCGTDCGEAKFCSECGTKLHRPNETNCTTRSDGADATESAVNLDIPVENTMVLLDMQNCAMQMYSCTKSIL